MVFKKPFLFVVFVFLFLSACSSLVQEDEDDFIDDIFEQDFRTTVEVLSHLGGDSSVVRVSAIEDVVCDVATNTLSFTLINRGFRVWSLNQRAAPDDQESVNIQVYLNGLQVNSRDQQTHPETSEVLFGPHSRFSENCGSQQIVRPSASVRCELSPVLLQETNVLRVQTHHADPDDQIRFRCVE